MGWVWGTEGGFLAGRSLALAVGGSLRSRMDASG